MSYTLKSFYNILGYTFKTETLLARALTHRSLNDENNERLEFLGDSLLNFFITRQLFARYAQASEGMLSRLRSNLVNEQMLASLARKLQISTYMRLGLGELKTKGVDRDSTLADALEAIIGAIYLDSDMDTCEKCVMAWYGEEFEIACDRGPQKDPKTRLQEYVQSLKIGLPIYTVLSIQANRLDQIFEVECQVNDLGKRARGQGRSRKRAEQEAAEQLLKTIF